MDKYIDFRLKQWARWSRRGNKENLGYGTSTIEYELHRMGGVLIKGKGTKPQVEHHPAAEEVEAAVVSMSQDLKEVAVRRYLEYGPPKKKAKDLHCSVKTYYRKVDNLHMKVQQYLDLQGKKEALEI